MKARVYRNEDVKKILAFIPEGHIHMRLILELEDQTLILQEATVAAIVRAYASVAMHPLRRAVELRLVELRSRKPFYAVYQLVETQRSEREVLSEAQRMWTQASCSKGEKES